MILRYLNVNLSFKCCCHIFYGKILATTAAVFYPKFYRFFLHCTVYVYKITIYYYYNLFIYKIIDGKNYSD